MAAVVDLAVDARPARAQEVAIVAAKGLKALAAVAMVCTDSVEIELHVQDSSHRKWQSS